MLVLVLFGFDVGSVLIRIDGSRNGSLDSKFKMEEREGEGKKPLWFIVVWLIYPLFLDSSFPIFLSISSI